MPTLAGFSGSSLTPDLTQSLNVALKSFGTKQERDKIAAEEAKKAEIAKQVELTIPQPGADPAAQRATEEAALIRLGALNPEIAKVTRNTLQAGDEDAKEVLRVQAEGGARNAAFIGKQPDFASRQKAIRKLANDAVARGEPLDRYIELQNLSEDELGLELQRMEIAAQDIKTVLTPTEQFVPVFDAAGNIIGQKSTLTGKVIADPRAAKEKETVRKRKIAAVREDYGIPTKEARDIVDGRIKLTTDPVTGQTMMTNIATGTTKPTATAPVAAAPPAAIPRAPEEVVTPEDTVFGMLEKGVGLVPTLQEGLAVTAGQVFPSALSPETTEARTRIRGLGEKLIRALSLSGRPPVIEQERLMNMLPSTGVFESAGHAEVQLRTLHGMLSRQYMEDMATTLDTTIPKKVRVQSAERAKGIGSVLREIGTPPARGEGAEEQINTQEEYNALPSGAVYIDAQTGQRGRKP